MNRRAALLGGAASLCGLAACARRGTIVKVPEAASIGAVQDILVASSRLPQDGPAVFSRYPSESLSFAEFQVSVPPQRDPGTVTLPTGSRPNPERDFLVVAQTPIPDRRAFVTAVNAALARHPSGKREAFVFVHGFNVTFAEGLYRHAQISHDFASTGVSISYSWPSAGMVAAYATDRESALIARDGLEDLIRLLAETRLSNIVLLGHSMGAFVVMEAVRQLAIRGERAALARVHAVVLMAPDIDLEVFRRQVRQISDARIPIYVFASSRDRALALSSFLRGSNARLGLVTDPAKIAGLPVTVIDVSDLQANNDAMNHFTVATSPAMISLLQGMGAIGLRMFRDQDRPHSLLEAGFGVVVEVSDAVLPVGQN